jgi:hypothetical protein
LDDEAPKPLDSPARDVVVVYRTPDVLQAHALAAQLVDEGIDAQVVGDFLGGGLTVTVGVTNMAEIWAPSESSDRAKELLARWVPQAEAPPDRGIHFSLKAALVGMTIVAIGAAGWRVAYSVMGLIGWAAFLGAMIVVVRRWTAAAPAEKANDAIAE